VAITAAIAAAASHDVVDDFAGLIALSATMRRWHIAKFYTPADDGASLGLPNPPPKTHLRNQRSQHAL
jgi:hypothetical protein